MIVQIAAIPVYPKQFQALLPVATWQRCGSVFPEWCSLFRLRVKRVAAVSCSIEGTLSGMYETVLKVYSLPIPTSTRNESPLQSGEEK